MKNIFFALVSILTLSLTSYAQEHSGVVVASSKTELAASKENGKYVFQFPEGISSESVEQTTKYYTHYFTVQYDGSSRKAIVTMVTNDEKSRSVIGRFFVANGIDNVNVEGTSMAVGEFFENYLK
ncbi:MAG: hypothetical protein EP305_07110 [Bacteroidetes bacterium]|nr:MAG: hypothetical protein EP305_07110 [Bacteroidota bacterium]